MPTPVDLAYDAWKEADAACRAAEARLRKDWLGFGDEGSSPSLPLLDAVAQLRRSADEKLRFAIDTAGVRLAVPARTRSGKPVRR